MSARPPRLARAAGLISLATLLSRLLGLVREQLFAALLGASLFADAFLVAFRIPNLLRDLFAEGALAQAFVPTFKASLESDGRSRAHLLANRVAGSLFVTIGLIVLCAGIFASGIVAGLAPDFSEIPRKFELTVLLTRIMLPFLPIISLAAVAMGMLNAQDRYGAPALAPATFNVVSIAVGTGLYLGGASGEWVAIGWSLGTVAAGLCQLGVQLPVLWRLGYRPKPAADLRLRDPAVRRVGALMLPAIGGLAAVQVNLVINTVFASEQPGAVSWLNYAFRLLQLPIGVFGVGIATVSTTRYADAAIGRDPEAMAAQLVESLRLVLFLTVPATAGLLLLDEPIIRLIFQRGRFTPDDTLATARALELFAVGLVAYSAVKIAAPAFYAVGRARLPLIASLCAVGGNLAVCLALHPRLGYEALALGVSSAAVLNFAVLYASFSRWIAPLPHLRLLAHLGRVGAAALVMSAAVRASYLGLAGWIGELGFWDRAAVTLAPIAIGVAVYALACKLLRVPELEAYTRRLSRRRRGAR